MLDISSISERINLYFNLLRLNKPEGILLLLWPALWGLFVAANGKPDFDILIIFIIGVVIMRSVGCVVNDLIDHDIDRHVSRTYNRPIASGQVSIWEALVIIVILFACAFFLALSLNAFAFKLSFVAVILTIIYPFMKQLIYLPQVFLGVVFAWSVPMAFAAHNNYINTDAWLIFIMTVLWVIVYDTMYAMVDREDDIKIGVKSTAILFDDADCLILACLQCVLLFAQLLIGTRLNLGEYYFIGVAVASMLAIYQQYLIRQRKKDKYFLAFLNNQWYGMAIFLGLYCDYTFA